MRIAVRVSYEYPHAAGWRFSGHNRATTGTCQAATVLIVTRKLLELVTVQLTITVSVGKAHCCSGNIGGFTTKALNQVRELTIVDETIRVGVIGVEKLLKFKRTFRVPKIEGSLESHGGALAKISAVGTTLLSCRSSIRRESAGWNNFVTLNLDLRGTGADGRA